jgi:uncharacterized membrane protein (UPF0127 family)
MLEDNYKMLAIKEIVFINKDGNKNFFKVWVAYAQKDLENGLRGLGFLDKDSGMVFENPSLMPIQMNMRGMKIPLDIIFVGVNQKITGIIEDAQPNDSYVQVYKSNIPSRYVVELKSGISKKLGIQLGTIFKFV